MKRKLLIGIFLAAVLSAGCSLWENAYEQASGVSLNVVSIDGPSALGLVKAMSPEIEPSLALGDTVQYTFLSEKEALYTKLLEEEVDAAVVPTELAFKLFETSESYKFAAITTEGNLYVVGKTGSAVGFSEMEGKEIRILDASSPADVIFKSLLRHHGLDPVKMLTLSYSSGGEALIEDAALGTIDFFVMPEPWVTAFLNENRPFSVVMDLQVEWSKIQGEGMPVPQTCLIVREETITDKNEAWRLFQEDYRSSVEWVNAHPEKAAELVERFEIGISEPFAEEIISRSHLIFLNTTDIKPAIQSYLTAFIQESPEWSEAKFPDEMFYSR